MEPSKQPGLYRRRSWIDPRIELRPSPIDGIGMFTIRAIAKGEPVVIWGGTVFTEEEIRAGKARRHSVAEIGEGLYLAAGVGEPESPDDFMNHSCDPNVWLADEVTLVAMRGITAGEELTADYAMWSTDPSWTLPIPCGCGSRLCRRAVTGNDWKRKDLEARYRSHFSPYINDRINLLGTVF